jgi:aminomethyltransferase
MKQTPLYESHKKLGAKMVDFGGWAMPVSYSGVLKEHHAVRQKVGLFDVSHMGEIFVEGPEALAFLQWVTCNDVNLLKAGQCQYTLLTRPEGGVVDDVILYRRGEKSFFFCVNASNIEKDYEWLLENGKKFEVDLKNRSDEYALLALQGPLAQEILQSFTSSSLSQLLSFHFVEARIDDHPVWISRTGYTGEDGFEIYSSPQDATSIWEKFLEKGKPLGLLPCGLGARDTLRLEMAYPLYGHELRDDITPLEAGLGWVVKLDKGDFLGRPVLLQQKEQGVQKKRVGFVMKDDGIAREGYPIFSQEEQVGSVSSGTYSPSLDKNIGCGYVRNDLAKIGTLLAIEIRGKKKMAEVVTIPFYKKQEK